MMKTLTTISVMLVAIVGLTVSGIVSAGARSAADDPFDPAGTYKTKCVACHGPKAEKKFDAAKSDDEHVQIILKGKKMEKPPNMPNYEEKGITVEQAKTLLEYMKSIRQ
jgi:mono/diheme cytochrome c family protein